MKKFIYLIAFLLTTQIISAQNWQLNQLRNNLELSDVHFLNSQTGFVFGDSTVSGALITGVVIKTIDAGQSWSTIPLGNPNYRIAKASVLNSNELFGAGRSGGGNTGLFIKSNDGGNSWISPSTFNERLNNVCFINSNSGWVMGRNGLLSRTTDGGTSWVSQNVTGEDLFCMKFFNASTGILGCGGGELYRTNDGGATWSPVNSNVPDGLLAISISGQEAWIGGEAGTIIYSADYGQTWTVQNATIPVDFTAISFANNTSGWIAGVAGTINATANGGGMWQSQSCGTTADISGLSVPDVNHGWFCTTDGEIFNFVNSTAINEHAGTDLNVFVYPNPAVDFIIISSAAAGKFKYSIVDANGKIVKQLDWNGTGSNPVNISELSSGFYNVVFVDHNSTNKLNSFCFVKK